MNFLHHLLSDSTLYEVVILLANFCDPGQKERRERFSPLRTHPLSLLNFQQLKLLASVQCSVFSENNTEKPAEVAEHEH